jgi:hypothetical protein
MTPDEIKKTPYAEKNFFYENFQEISCDNSFKYFLKSFHSSHQAPAPTTGFTNN